MIEGNVRGGGRNGGKMWVDSAGFKRYTIVQCLWREIWCDKGRIRICHIVDFQDPTNKHPSRSSNGDQNMDS